MPDLGPEEWAAKYKCCFDQGYEAMRVEILARQKALGLLPEDTEPSSDQPPRASPGPPVPRPALAPPRLGPALGLAPARTSSASSAAWPRSSPATSPTTTTSSADPRLPRNKSGEHHNTIIVVISDNGASGEGGPDGTFNEWRFFNGMETSTEETLTHIDELGGPLSNNHYNTGWAWAFDTPFPYWKRWAGYEGGVSDMCIVSWPERISAHGEVRSQYVHAVDVVPTLYDLLDSRAARGAQGPPAAPHRGGELRRRPDPTRRPPPSPRSSTPCSASRSTPTTEGWLGLHGAPAPVELGALRERRLGAVRTSSTTGPRARTSPLRSRSGSSC